MYNCKLLVFLLCIWCLPASDANKYCGSNSCNNTKELTLCKFQSAEPARHCVDHVQTIKTWKDKRAVLDKLNSRRNKVAAGAIRSLPAAEGMIKLEWNKELEASAQRWANQCVKYSVPDLKDSCRDMGGVLVGQSIATIVGESPGLTPAALVDVWYMELLNINSSVLSHYRPSTLLGYPSYDYFTQLVWAETSEVGCGAVKFKERSADMSGQRDRTIYRLVCNFAPGGNRLNRPVYTEGLPCSRCPAGGNCDAVYKALCSLNTSDTRIFLSTNSTGTTDMVKVLNMTVVRNRSNGNISTTTKAVDSASSNTDAEDIFNPINYFSHLHEFVRPTLTTTTTLTPCINMSAMDNILELLKKKLSTDPLFMDLITTKLPFGQDAETDSNVAAFVDKLYSRETTSSPTTVTSDYVNSTLLVDLVEAVIFRNSDKTRPSLTNEYTTQYSSDVSAIKIQAEFGEAKPNNEFTGHYFFPEDVDTGRGTETTTELNDSYDDAITPRVSDVIKEIEDIKRRKHTKDFLEDILDSEYNEKTETTSYIFVTNHEKATTIKSDDSFNDLLTRIKRDGFQNANNYNNVRDFRAYKNINLKSLLSNYGEMSYQTCHIKYSALLKKIATDLRVLKLNDRFHCTKSSSNTFNFNWLLLNVLLCLMNMIICFFLGHLLQ